MPELRVSGKHQTRTVTLFSDDGLVLFSWHCKDREDAEHLAQKVAREWSKQLTVVRVD